jgi:hypothetical protein
MDEQNGLVDAPILLITLCHHFAITLLSFFSLHHFACKMKAK